MKKIIIVILALILLLGLGAMSVNAKAVKVSLFDRSDWVTEVDGWVIVNINAAGEIIVEVSVKKVEANTEFLVYIKTNLISGTDAYVGKFMTNEAGNGNFHYAFDSEGVEKIQVVFREDPGTKLDGYGMVELEF